MSNEELQYETIASKDEQTVIRTTSEAKSGGLVGTILDGKIRIESLIGQGGMSVVYKGTHMVLNRSVAVKVILPSLGFNDKAIMRLQQEAKAAFSLSHSNLASVHDVSVTEDGLAYLVMDFAEGETLSSMLDRGPIGLDKVLQIFMQLAAGLNAAHTQGVIHRDIKPGNIMVEHGDSGAEVVKIVDFGIAKKVTENSDEIQKLTQTGEVFGTPLYMSPEQCKGEKLDARSDIYSLGCVMYEAITGEPPFKGESAIATIMMHLNRPAPTPAKELKVPTSVVDVVHRCMEKERSDRYQTMDQLYKDLAAIKDGAALAKKRPTGRKASKSRLLRIGVGIIAAALVGNLAIYLVNFRQNNSTVYHTIEQCNRAIALHPNDDHAYYWRGRLSWSKAHYSQALNDYNKALQINPKSAEALLCRAQVYNHYHRYDDALADLDKVPYLVSSLGERAIALRHKGNYKQALVDANKFLATNPPNASVMATQAVCHIAEGKYEEALKACNDAINQAPTRSYYYVLKAQIYLYLGQTENAIAESNTAISMDRSPLAYCVRALSHLKLHELVLAQQDANLALQLQPENALVLLTAAQIAMAQNQFQQALTYCQKAQLMSPNSAAVYQITAEVYKKLGNQKSADEALQKYATLKTVPSVDSLIL